MEATPVGGQQAYEPSRRTPERVTLTPAYTAAMWFRRVVDVAFVVAVVLGVIVLVAAFIVSR